MITVDSEGLRKLLDIFENVVESGEAPDEEAVNGLVSTSSVSFLIEAYSRWSDFSKDGFVTILANLANAYPVGQGGVLVRLEEGFRSCLDQKKIESLRQKLEKILRLDFAEAERIALRYLPPETPIKSTIYLTIDTYNSGMVYAGNISLSILNSDPENFNFSFLAHELHHSGFHYWVRRNPKLKNLAFKGSISHEEIAVNMILHLLSEGLANHYCTPNMVRIHQKYSEKHNQKVKKYESNLNLMLLEIQSLLSGCISKDASVEKCRRQLNSIVLDPEGVLPPVHFIGARLMETFNKNPRIVESNIIDLCREPFRFFTFYSKVCQKYGFPQFPDEVIERVSKLLGAP